MKKQTKMKNCYIAGKIGNLPIEVYTTNFTNAKLEVMKLGHNPVSPLDIHHDCKHSTEWIDFMRCDLSALLNCDLLYACSNWVASKGADIEVNLAHKLGIEIIFQNPMHKHYFKP